MRLAQPKAIVQMWYSGEGGGRAIAETLFGINNPSGKLPVTFMREINPDVKFCADGRYMDYKDGLFVGYRYYDEHPEKIWYPFGHGLSYTTFEYSALEITSKDAMSAEVSFSVTNTGEVNDWHAESGRYGIWIGASSQDIRLKGEIEIVNKKDYTINREKWANVAENIIMAGN